MSRTFAGIGLAAGSLALASTLTLTPSASAATASTSTTATNATAASNAAESASSASETVTAEFTAAASSTKRVAIYMPFSGGGRTGIIKPANHTPRLLGGYSWDLHKAAGAAVIPQMTSPDGQVSLKVSRVVNNGGGAGKRMTLLVSVDNTYVGEINFGHLTNLQVSTSTGYFSPGRVIGYMPSGLYSYSGCADGTADGWPYSSSWRVCTASGVHTHVDFQRACWGSFPTYTVLGASTPIAMMSTGLSTSTNRQCSASELAGASASANPVDDLSDGDFITGAGYTWRIAGGAPVLVATWETFGGRKTTTPLTSAQFAQLASVPADGTYLRGLPSNRLFVIAGGAPILATGITPTRAVTEVDDVALDNITSTSPYNRLRATPSNGTFLRTASSKQVYVVAGGSPLYVSTSAPWGGLANMKYVTVPDASIANAGGSGAYARLAAAPAEGSFIRGKRTGGIFRIVGGSPQWVRSWDDYGGVQAYTNVDDAAIDRAGSGLWTNLNSLPAEGSLLRTSDNGRVYQITGGAPVYVSSRNLLANPNQTSYVVSSTVIDDAGTDGRGHAHLLDQPADGTYVKANGATYVFADGTAFLVHSWAAYGGAQSTITIDPAALTNAGSSDQPWGGHISAAPSDGTFVTTLDGADAGQTYVAAGGALIPVASCDALGDCADAFGLAQASIDTFTTANPTPADGTALKFLPSGTIGVYTDGTCAIVTGDEAESAAEDAVSVNDGDVTCGEATDPEPTEPEPTDPTDPADPTDPTDPDGPAASSDGQPAPTRPTVTIDGDTATITWAPPTEEDGTPLAVQSYEVIGGIEGSGEVTISEPALANATTIEISDLAEGTYVFQVRALYADSQWSTSRGSAGTEVAAVPAG